MLKSKINPDLSGIHTKLILTFLFFTFLSTNLYAQYAQWVSRYNGTGNGNDNATSIAVDDSGNVYVTGNSPGIGTGTDYATIKYNSAGVQQWIQRYNGPGNGNDDARSIAVDDSGNAYVTGSNFTTIKYNSSGVQQWIQIYGGGGANSIAVDDSGNAYVTGSNYTTIKYNSSGVQQWIKTDGGVNATSIAVDDSGNVYVTGTRWSSIFLYDYLTIKYNSSGVQQWLRIYDCFSGFDEASSIVVDNSGNVYVTGSSMDMETFWDYATIKYNSNGDSLWVKRYGGDGAEYARSIAVDGSGNVYVTGSGYTTIKYNSSGVQQWIKIYGGSGEDIVVDGFGNVYVTGSKSGSVTGTDYVTIKYDTGGVQQWDHIYNGPGNGGDGASSIAVDNLGNFYVTGSSTGIVTGSDYATIKYIQQYPPPLCAFNLQSPLAGDTITSVINSTIPVSFSWDTSATGVSYKWLFGTSLPTRLITQHVFTNSLTMTLGYLDNILAAFGLYPGDQLVGAWDIWAFRQNPPQNDSLKAANGPRNITFKRGSPVLTAFNLSSPPNATQINTSQYNDSLIHMKWTRSGVGTPFYKWKFGSPTIANTVLTFEANNSGYDSLFSIRNSSLDSILASLGMLPGEMKVGEWAVWAYNGIDSLKSTQTYGITLRRANLIVLFYDPFSTGTGKWIITNSYTFIWHIFSAPYPNAYTLPPTSVSPVFSADGYYCGTTSLSTITATVANNINCVGYENISIEFDNDWNSYSISTAYVEASYNGGSTWDTIISFGGDARNTHEIKSLPGASNIPNLKVRFRTTQANNYTWWTIDNVTIKGDLVTGITKSESQIPTDYTLSQNYPNPFNPSTEIKFDIPKPSYVKLIVYDVLGREIKILVNEKLNAGRYRIDWDGSSYPSGVYFYKMVTDEYVSVKKMLMIK